MSPAVAVPPAFVVLLAFAGYTAVIEQPIHLAAAGDGQQLQQPLEVRRRPLAAIFYGHCTSRGLCTSLVRCISSSRSSPYIPLLMTASQAVAFLYLATTSVLGHISIPVSTDSQIRTRTCFGKNARTILVHDRAVRKHQLYSHSLVPLLVATNSWYYYYTMLLLVQLTATDV